MKRVFLSLAVTLIVGVGSVQAADVAVSVSVGHPEFYGRIDIGRLAPPPVIYDEPRLIRPPRVVVLEPLYLRVPPGHAKNWRKYCSRYDACGRRVYFVRDEWYRDVYAPRYREEHHGDSHDDHGRGHDNGRKKGRGKH